MLSLLPLEFLFILVARRYFLGYRLMLAYRLAFHAAPAMVRIDPRFVRRLFSDYGFGGAVFGHEANGAISAFPRVDQSFFHIAPP